MSEENAVGLDYGDVVAGYRLETGDFAESVGAIVRGYGAIGVEVLELIGTLSGADCAFAGLGAAAVNALAAGTAASRQFVRDTGIAGAAVANMLAQLAEMAVAQAQARNAGERTADAVARPAIPSQPITPAPAVAAPRQYDDAALMDKLRQAYRQCEVTVALQWLRMPEIRPNVHDERGMVDAESAHMGSSTDVPQHGAHEPANEHWRQRAQQAAFLTDRSGLFAGEIPDHRYRLPVFPQPESAVEHDESVQSGRMETPGGGSLPTLAHILEKMGTASGDAPLTLLERMLESSRQSLRDFLTQDTAHVATPQQAIYDPQQPTTAEGYTPRQMLPVFAGRSSMPAVSGTPSPQPPVRLEITVKAGGDFSADIAAIADQRIQVVVLPALQTATIS